MKTKKLPVVAAICLSSMLSSLHTVGFEDTKLGVDGSSVPAHVQEFINDFAANAQINDLAKNHGNAQETNNNSGKGERDEYPYSQYREYLKEHPEKRDWNTPFPEYAPVYFASIKEHKNHEYPNGFKYADPCGTFKEDGDLEKLKTLIQDQVDLGRKRVSDVEETRLNPFGRTGVRGPGELGCFGPNQAVDSVIFCCIDGIWKVLLTQRPKGDAWALAGGMIDANDGTSRHAFKRELKEETGLDYNERHTSGLIHEIGIAYQGFSDDLRNTDNAWAETTAYVSILNPEALKTVKLAAEDPTEITGIRWVNLTEVLDGTRPLFASHTRILADAVRLVSGKATKKRSSCNEDEKEDREIKKSAV